MVVPAISVSNFGDLQNVTRPDQAVGRITDIASSLRKATFMGLLLKEGKIKKSMKAGKSFTWTCFVNGSGSFASVPIVYQDQLSNVDTTAVAVADWRHNKVDWPEVAQVTAMNTGDDVQIASTRMLQEKAADLSFVEGMERLFWGSPVAITDTLSMWGVNTWLPKPATYTVDGFVGTVPVGYTIIGLDPTIYPNWKSYYAQYTNVTDDDFVRRLNKAINDTSFESLVDGLPVFNNKLERVFFSNYGLIGPIQELLKMSNENLGMDISLYLGKPVINGIPVVNVPFLDADTTNPRYALNVGDWEMAYLNGFWMKQLRIPNMPGFHNVAGNFKDTTGQIILRDRRKSFLMATGTSYPS